MNFPVSSSGDAKSRDPPSRFLGLFVSSANMNGLWLPAKQKRSERNITQICLVEMPDPPSHIRYLKSDGVWRKGIMKPDVPPGNVCSRLTFPPVATGVGTLFLFKVT